jgi:hypothetical protein
LEIVMDVVKQGKKGQLSQPAPVYPVELYSDARVKRFEKANRLAAPDVKRVQKALRRGKR